MMSARTETVEASEEGARLFPIVVNDVEATLGGELRPVALLVFLP